MHITKNTHTLQNPQKHTHYKTLSHTHTRIHTHALQLRKKHRKTLVRLRKTSIKVQYAYYQKHPHITKPSQAHTLQNNIKPPQHKLKQIAYRKSNST